MSLDNLSKEVDCIHKKIKNAAAPANETLQKAQTILQSLGALLKTYRDVAPFFAEEGKIPYYLMYDSSRRVLNYVCARDHTARGLLQGAIQSMSLEKRKAAADRVEAFVALGIAKVKTQCTNDYGIKF